MQSPNPLGHLNNAEMGELIDRYYAGERLSDLLRDFNVQCRANQLCAHFPPEPSDQVCRYCGAQMVRPRPARSAYDTHQLHCSGCLHVESRHCDCHGCKESRRLYAETQAKQRKERAEQFSARRWSYEETHVQPEDLSAREAVALICLVRSGGWLDEARTGPLHSADIPLAPAAPKFVEGLLEGLINRGLVSPDPNSSVSAFLELNGEIRDWNLQVVNWTFRIPRPVDFVSSIEELAAQSEWPPEWHAQSLELWHDLAVAECWEFCQYSVSTRGLPMPGTVGVLSLIENLLRDFSVSQCYQLLWASAGGATDYRARKSVSAQHASNYLIGECQRRADRSRAEGWPIKGFHRNFKLGRSQLSHVLHDVFLKHGEAGFYSCATLRQ